MEPLPSPLVARTASAVLLLAGGGVAVATVVVPSSDGLAGAAVAIAAAGLLSLLLGTESLRRHRLLAVGAATAALVVTAVALRSVGADVAAVAAPAAGALVLLWAAVALGRGGALRMAGPALVASAAAWSVHGADVPVAAYAILPATLAVAELLAWPLARARRNRELVQTALTDIDSLLIAALDLRGVEDVATCADRICRLGAELLHGDGALLYVQGPGRLLLAGRHGAHAEPLDTELGRDATLQEVLHSGAVVATEGRVLVPVSGVAGVVGALDVAGPHRPIDALTTGVAQLFGSHVGAVLDRLNAVDSLFDAATRDPVTGVGNRQQATAVIASLRPGDGFLLLDVDDFDSLRAGQGDAAANLLLGQVGLHLRNGTRTGDAVARYGDHEFVIALRELKAPISMVVERLVSSWLAATPSRTLSVGGALHLEGEAPMDTLERADAALASAKRKGGGQGHVAPDWSVFVAS